MSTAKRGLILNQGYGLHYKYGKLGITNGQWMTVLFSEYVWLLGYHNSFLSFL